MMMKKNLVLAFFVAVVGCAATKNAAILPQRPRFQEMLRSTLTRPRSGTESVGHAIDAGLLVYESVQAAAAWLKGIKDRTRKKEEYLYDHPEESPLNSTSEMSRLMDDIQVCKPYQLPKEVCHSRCMPYKHYSFCWITNKLKEGSWAPCRCRLRRSVKRYLLVIKEELLRRFKRLQDLHTRVVSPLEVVLLVVAGISALVILFLAVIWCRHRKSSLIMRQRLAEAASQARAASFRAARRTSCALSRHLPKASASQSEATEALAPAPADVEVK